MEINLGGGNLCEEKIYTGFFKDHFQAIYRLIYYKCGNESLSKDVAQDAFMQLWRKCSEIRMESARAYVYKSALNGLTNKFKHQKVRMKFAQTKQQEHSNESAPDFILEEQEFKILLENAIVALPEKQREAFLMSRIDKKTYNEIAEILGISRQAVEKRIYNALDSLRKISKKIR